MLENSVDYTLGEYGLKPSSFVLPEDVYFSDAVQDGETILTIDNDLIGNRIAESQ